MPLRAGDWIYLGAGADETGASGSDDLRGAGLLTGGLGRERGRPYPSSGILRSARLTLGDWADDFVAADETGASGSDDLRGVGLTIGAFRDVGGSLLDDITSEPDDSTVASLLTLGTIEVISPVHSHAATLLELGAVELFEPTALENRADVYAIGLEVAYEAPASEAWLYSLGLEVAYRWNAPQLYSSVPRLAPTRGVDGATLVPLFELDLADGSTIRRSEIGVDTNLGHYEAGVLSFGSLVRETAPEGGQFRIGEASVTLPNSDNAWSRIRATSSIRGLVGRVRLARIDLDGSTSIITIFTGIINNWRLTPTSFEITLVDRFFDKLKRRLTIPVNEYTFPLLPASTQRGKAIPIPMGIHSTLAGERPGALPAFLVDPQFYVTSGTAATGSGSALVSSEIDSAHTIANIKTIVDLPQGGQWYAKIGGEVLLFVERLFPDEEPDQDPTAWRIERGKNGVIQTHSADTPIIPLLGFRYVAAQGDPESIDAVYIHGEPATGGGVHYEVSVEDGGNVLTGSLGLSFFWLGKVVFFDFVGDPRQGINGIIPADNSRSLSEVTYDAHGIKETGSVLTATNPVSQLSQFLRTYAEFTDADIDTAAETIAKLEADKRGLKSAFLYLNDDDDVRAVIERFAESFNLSFVSTVDGRLRFLFPAQDILSPGFVDHLTEELHVLIDSFSIEGVYEVVSSSRVLFRHDWVAGNWKASLDFFNPDNASAIFGSPRDLELWYVPDQSSAVAAAAQVFYFAADARNVVRIEVDPHLYSELDLGAPVALSHRSGPTADGAGWSAAFFRIVGMGFDLDGAPRLSLTLVDVAAYAPISTSAGWRAVESWAPAGADPLDNFGLPFTSTSG